VEEVSDLGMFLHVILILIEIYAETPAYKKEAERFFSE
jgi:hypothetical protein